VLAVVLQGQIRDALPGGEGAGVQRLPEDVRARVAEPLADAFAHTFWWAVAFSLIALLPALVLMQATRKPPGDEPAAEPDAGRTAVRAAA
jgi:hypothetical protein